MNYLFRTFEDVFHCLIIKDLCCSDSDQLIYFITELFRLSRTFLIYFLKFFNFFAVLSISNSFILSNSFAFVKNFFQLFFKVERRRRDLNPRAAINDLLPFQGSPFSQLGYFSIVCLIHNQIFN